MTAILETGTEKTSDTPATPVFAARIRHPSAWTVADFRSPADYSVDLDAAQLRDIRPVHPYIRSRGILPVAGRTPSFDWNSITPVHH